MFLSALQPYIVAIIIAVIILQYALALFCLLKLAYLDIDKKYYILWNLFILIVFFIGDAVFLVYYYKHPELKLSAAPAPSEKTDTADSDGAVDAASADSPSGEDVELADDKSVDGSTDEQTNADERSE